MEQEIYVAVDLGNSQMRMMAASKDEEGKLNILGIETAKPKDETIQNGIIKNSSEVAWSINDLAIKLTNKLNNGQDINGLYISVNGRTLRTIRGKVQRTFESPTEITRNDLNSLKQELYSKKIEGKDIYGVTNEEYVIDGDIVRNPEGMLCRNIEANYLIVYARNDIRISIDKCFDRIAQNKMDEIPAPMAIAAAVTSADDKQLGCAVLNFGAATTTVAVYQDNYLRHMAIIPFGSNHITSDLKYLNLSFDKAEKIKCQLGTPIANEQSALTTHTIKGKAGEEDRKIKSSDMISIIEARLSEIVTLCMNEIKRSGYIDRLQAGIIVTGGGSKMKDFIPFMRQKTQMDVRFGSHTDLLSASTPAEYQATEYSLLVGLLHLADKPCTSTPQPDNKPIRPKTKEKGWGSKILNLFNGDENSIED